MSNVTLSLPTEVVISSTSDALNRYLNTEVSTKIVGICFYVPGQEYTLITSDRPDDRSTYRTTIISIEIDEYGTTIRHKPFKTAKSSERVETRERRTFSF